MYSQDDFERCLFNPCKKNLFEVYPRLMTIKSINEKLIRYIIAVYDYNSPIVRENRDLKLRKQEAAKFAGYDFKKEGEYLEGLYSLKDEIALTAVDVFLKEFLYNRLWFRICGDEQVYWESGKRLLKPLEKGETKDKDDIAALKAKAELGEKMQEIDLRLDAAYKKLYGEEDLSKFTSRRALPEDMSTKA